MAKPIILNKFIGMGTNANGDSGVFYSEGFYPRVENGQMMMSEVFSTNEIFNKDTTGYDDLGTITSIIGLKRLETGASYTLVSNGEEIYAYKEQSPDITNGLVHTIYSNNKLRDFQLTNNGNLLYTVSSGKVGVGYRGRVKTGSSTTTIIDLDGRDLASLFPTLATGHNKVTNLKTGVEYTITSITTTDSTNDTLNFTASGSSANTSQDEFIIWYDDKFDLNSTTPYPQFSGQESLVNYKLQIDQYESYYFLNGNFLGNLGTDESTFDDNYKQLPSRHQGLSLSINGDKMLISSQKDGNGYLLLWDTVSDNWNSIFSVDKTIYCLKPYRDGWVYHSGGSIYYTDGFSRTKLSDLPDKEEISSTFDGLEGFNSILVDEDSIYLVLTSRNSNRLFNGIYYFNLNFGWTFIPFKYDSQKYYESKCIYKNTIGLSSTLFKPYIDIGGEYSYNRMDIDTSNTSTNLSNNFVYELNLNNKTQIKNLKLGVISNLRNNFSSTEKYCDLYISVWGGKYGYAQKLACQFGTTSSVVILKSSSTNVDIGNQIFIYEDTAFSTPLGERTFITSLIEETATYNNFAVSPSVSTSGSSNAVVIPTKFTFHKTIKLSELEDDITIPIDKHFSDKLFIQVMTRGIENSFPVSITNINIE